MPPPDPPVNNNESEAFVRKLAGFQSVLPQYDGLSAISPTYFVENVETVTELAKCSDQEKLLILRSRIRGDALTSVITSPDLNDEKDYSEFKKKFLSFFDTQYSLGARQKQFSNCVMNPNESVKMYSARVSVATLRFFNSPDLSNPGIKSIFEQTKLAKFIDGLPSCYKNAVILKDPKSFQDAVSFVQTLQSNEISHDEILNTQLTNNISVSADNSEIKSILEAHASHTTQLINNLAKDVENLKLQTQNPKRAYDAGPFTNNTRRGTEFSRFRRNRSSFSNSNPTCRICNRSSHFTSDCYYNTARGNFQGRGNSRGMRRSPQYNYRGSHNNNPRGTRYNYGHSENR